MRKFRITALAALAAFAPLGAPAMAADFLIIVRPNKGVAENPTKADEAAINAHFQRLVMMQRRGELILAGPAGKPSEMGLIILTAPDLAAARAIAESDPAVKAGSFAVDKVLPIAVALTKPAPASRDYVANPTDRAVVKSVTLKAAPAQVWEAWTTPAGMNAVLGVEAKIDLRIGGPFELYFNPDKSSTERGSEGMRILSFLPERMLSFEWNAPPQFPAARAKRAYVVVMMSEAGPGLTKVTLEHRGFGEGAEWDAVFAYFEKAWGGVLGAFGKKFGTA